MAYCNMRGAQIPEGASLCSSCGKMALNEADHSLLGVSQGEYPVQPKRNLKKRKPLFKRWWFWVVALIVIGSVFGRQGMHRTQTVPSGRIESNAAATPARTDQTSQGQRQSATPEPTPVPDTTPVSEVEIRLEVKEFLDAYEAYMNEYVEFMQRYSTAEPADMAAMMGDYYAMMSRYAVFSKKIDDLDESELNNAELAYYLEVTNRVNQKLLAVAG